MIAVICGTPTPEMTRVVQIEPGPMPTFTASAPASIRSLAPLGGRHVAGNHVDIPVLLDLADRFHHVGRMAVGTVDHQHVDAFLNQAAARS